MPQSGPHGGPGRPGLEDQLGVAAQAIDEQGPILGGATLRRPQTFYFLS